MRKIVLDTNAYTALIEGREPVKKAIEHAEEVFVPVFVLAELFFGFKNGTKEQDNLSLLDKFMKLPGVSTLNTTNETARIYADLLLGLKKKGKPIPTHDIWISACAIETGSVIVTYDKHFLNVTKARIWPELD